MDHIYPGSENHSHVAVLYAELGTSEFSVMHSSMKDLASKNLLTYVFRHYVKVKTVLIFTHLIPNFKSFTT